MHCSARSRGVSFYPHWGERFLSLRCSVGRDGLINPTVRTEGMVGGLGSRWGRGFIPGDMATEVVAGIPGNDLWIERRSGRSARTSGGSGVGRMPAVRGGSVSGWRCWRCCGVGFLWTKLACAASPRSRWCWAGWRWGRCPAGGTAPGQAAVASGADDLVPPDSGRSDRRHHPYLMMSVGLRGRLRRGRHDQRHHPGMDGVDCAGHQTGSDSRWWSAAGW